MLDASENPMVVLCGWSFTNPDRTTFEFIMKPTKSDIPSSFISLRTEHCQELPLDKLNTRLNMIDSAEAKQIEELKAKYRSFREAIQDKLDELND